jgi:hypothetical protein
MRKPRPAAPNLDALIREVGSVLARTPAAPLRVSVLLEGRLISRFIHVPTMAGRVAAVIRNEGKDLR